MDNRLSKIHTTAFDIRLLQKLNEQGIHLPYYSEQASFKDAITETILMYPYRVGLFFCINILPKLLESPFTKIEKVVNSADFLTIAQYIKASVDVQNYITEKRSTKNDASLEKLWIKNRNLLSAEEVETLTNETTDIVNNLQVEIQAVYDWIIDDVKPREAQELAAKAYAQEVSKVEKSMAEKIGMLADKVLEAHESSFAGGHNFWQLNKRAEIGFLPPPKKLIADIEKVLIYLTTLEYCNPSVYANISSKC